MSSVVLSGVDYSKDNLLSNGTTKDVPLAAATEDVLPLNVPSSAANEDVPPDAAANDVPPQDIPPDAAANDVPPPAVIANVLSPIVRASSDGRTIDNVKDAETISNSCERRIVKIRLKKPTPSFKTDGNGNLVETSRGWLDEADVGHSSSVSVDAPPPRLIIKETLSMTNQVREEVNFFRGHESHNTASVESAMIANNDDMGKELQCIADSRNGIDENRSLPTFTRTNGEDDPQKSSCLPVLSVQRHDEDDTFVHKDDREKRENESKDKKHKDKKRKRDDKSEDKDRHNDHEYLEKKEKKRMEKKLAKVQQKEATTTSKELQSSQMPASTMEISPLVTSKNAEGTSQVASINWPRKSISTRG